MRRADKSTAGGNLTESEVRSRVFSYLRDLWEKQGTGDTISHMAAALHLPSEEVAKAARQLKEERKIWNRPIGYLPIYVFRTAENEPLLSDPVRVLKILEIIHKGVAPATISGTFRLLREPVDRKLFAEIESAGLLTATPMGFHVSPHGYAWMEEVKDGS